MAFCAGLKTSPVNRSASGAVFAALLALTASLKLLAVSAASAHASTDEAHDSAAFAAEHAAEVAAEHAAHEDDLYTARCVFYSDGRVERFGRSPIVLQIGPTPPGVDAERFESAMRRAAAMWEEASGGAVRFRFAESEEEPFDVPVRWVTQLSERGRETHLGRTVLSRRSGASSDVQIRMEIGVYDARAGKELSDDMALTVCLHELGHAIGIWGHSDRAEDVMSPASEARKPTERDAATLRAVYRLPVGTGLHDAAIQELRREIAANPRDADPRYLLGTVALDVQRYETAVNALEAAVRLDRFHPHSAEKLILAYLGAGRYREAAHRLHSGRVHSPETYNNAGIAFANAEEFQEAVKALKKALEAAPGMEEARRNLARVHSRVGIDRMNAGDSEEARRAFREAWRFDKRPSYGIQLAAALGRLDRHLEAAQVYRSILAAHPDHSEARKRLAASYNDLGVDAVDQERWEKAIGYFEKSAQADPESKMGRRNRQAAVWNWASSLLESNPGKAADLLREYLSADPTAWEAHAQIGVLYSRAGAYEKAIQEYLAALEMQPGRKSLLRNLAIAHYKRGSRLLEAGLNEEASAAFLKAVERDSNLVGSYRGLAVAFQRIGNWADAADALEEALEREPDDEWAQNALMNAAVALGNAALEREEMGAAARELERAPMRLRTGPVHAMLGFLYTTLERNDAAVDSLGKALLANPEDEASRKNLEAVRKRIRDQMKEDESFQWRGAWIRLEAYRLAAQYGRKRKKGDLEKFEKFLNVELQAGESDLIEAGRTAIAIQDCAAYAAEESRADYPSLARAIETKARRFDAARRNLERILRSQAAETSR